MSYKFLFVLNALVAVLLGLGFLAVPDVALPLLGITEQYASTVWAARFFGSALFALGLVLWFAKDTDAHIQKGMGWALFISTLIGLVLTVAASFAGNAILRQNAWVPVVVYAFFALGYGFMLFIKPKMKEE